MKRLIALILAVVTLLSLSACGKKQEEPAVPETVAPTVPATAPIVTEPATEPAPATEPEPASEPGYVRAGDVGVLWKLFNRGDEVKVLGQWKDYYVIEGEEVDLLIEKRFLRPENEETPEETAAWARSKTLVYGTAYLRGEPIATLRLNTKLRVIDTKGNWALVEWDDGTGYVDVKQISKWYISNKSTGSSNDSGYSGDSSSAPSGSSAPKDGTDVYLPGLSFFGGDVRVELLGVYNGPKFEKFDDCKGMVLSAETEAYLTILVRGDIAKVTEIGEDTCSVLVDQWVGTVPRWAVKMENDPEYESWTGYTKWGTIAYQEYQQKNELNTFGFNEKVQVVDELTEQELYVIEYNGEFGYLNMKKANKFRYSSAPASNASGSYEGGSGSGSSGGSGGGGGTSSPEWTPPIK